MFATTYLCSIIFLTFFACLSAQDPPIFRDNVCSGTNYTTNSTYFSNLKTLLASLSNSTSPTFFSTGFQSNTIGDKSSDNMVSGFFLCQGDLSAEECRDCVVFGVKDTLANRCSRRKEAMINYEVCTIRYADRDVLSDGVDMKGFLMMNEHNVTAKELDRFSYSLISLMNEAKEEAADNSRKFATKANITPSQSVYVMVQCIHVLNRENCAVCLQKIFDVLPRYKIGGRIVRPMCNVRYESYLFFSKALIPPPVSAPPQPAQKTQNVNS